MTLRLKVFISFYDFLQIPLARVIRLPTFLFGAEQQSGAWLVLRIRDVYVARKRFIAGVVGRANFYMEAPRFIYCPGSRLKAS